MSSSTGCSEAKAAVVLHAANQHVMLATAAANQRVMLATDAANQHVMRATDAASHRAAHRLVARNAARSTIFSVA
ncbi:MAG: hypothetical protein NTX02_01590 [Planctomycetia bacterium]|nr:hypothetical protein [Planctomycetia bacterium]